MKIVDIEVIELRVPGWTGDTFDGSYDNCLVLVHTDEGLSGITEVDSVPSVIRAIVDAHCSALKSGTGCSPTVRSTRSAKRRTMCARTSTAA
jgi:hypothetical protein